MNKEVAPQGELFGHPKGLYYLFFAEMWERFSFYGMRALLVLYLTNEIFQDLANGTDVAYEIYAAYGALVYFTPAIGGMLADRLIGHKNSILLGGILMTLGHFIMVFEDEYMFYGALGLLIIGNGFFKPNISTLVGGLYKQGDPRRDGGFTIFYMGINLGAFLAPLLCGWLGASYGWHWGFGAAGVGMLLGLIVFWSGIKGNIYGDQGNQPQEILDKPSGGRNQRILIWILAFLSVPLFGYLVNQNATIVFGDMGLLSLLLLSLLAVVIVYIIYICLTKVSAVERNKLIVIMFLTFFVTVFWAFFEQAGSSLTLFAEGNVDLVVLNAAQTNSINPFFIIVLAIPFSMLWTWLDKRKKNPRTPVKFALGIAQLGLGFLIFALSANSMSDTGVVPMWFLVVGYLLLTTGELFISPIGLSKVTELSPAWLVSFMMGTWFLSSSFAHYIAGVIAKMTSGGGEAGTEPGLLAKWANGITGLGPEALQGANEGVLNLANYTSVFGQIAFVSFGFAILALLMAPLLNRWMGDAH
jgi:POT family proton-dependent oligopeptide transporter